MSRSMSVSGDMTTPRPIPEGDANFERSADEAIDDA